jgi:hypothetical protein
MSRCRCPIAYPLAWRNDPHSACTRAGFGPRLPANDFPPVSQPDGVSVDWLCPAVLGGSSGVLGLPGEVDTCPVVAPVGWLSLHTLPLPSASYLPANEKKNGVQSVVGTGGER